MATCVILTVTTDWSLVKNSVKTAKFWSRRQPKSFFSKIFQNLFFYFDDFPFIKASLGNRTFNTTIVSCAILSGSWKAEIWNVLPAVHIQKFHCIKVFSGYTASSSTVMGNAKSFEQHWIQKGCIGSSEVYGFAILFRLMSAKM